MSTRPDYIDKRILDNLKRFDADTIELGVQSFDDEVLSASGRGHTAEDVYKACDLIKEYGFELGIQLMIGLPGDSLQKCIYSSKETVKVSPSIARLYPTIVLNDTKLYEMYKAGTYHALTTDEAVAVTKEMYKIIAGAGINIIRVGLKSTDLISGSGRDDDQTAGHTYHPAFRQLVEGEIAREELETQLKALYRFSHGDAKADTVCFCSNGVSFSNMVGNSNRNRRYFEEKYPQLKFRFEVDDTLENMQFRLKDGLYKKS
jgi:histone acetyltransferase (RNA polymerase elongator complex component)